MKNSVGMISTVLAVLVVLAQAATGEAADIKVFSANGMREVMEDLGPKFEHASSHRLAIAFATLGVTVKRVQDGETADVIVVRQGWRKAGHNCRAPRGTMRETYSPAGTTGTCPWVGGWAFSNERARG